MKAFEEEYKDNIKAVFAYLMAATGDYHLAEELTQETFYRAYRGIKHFRGECKVSVWLCQIAKHCLVDYRKKERRHVSMANVEPRGEGLSADKVLQQKEDMGQMVLAVATLPSPYREVFMLHYYAGMPLKEIANLHDKSDSWARVTYFRAREKLQIALKGADR